MVTQTGSAPTEDPARVGDMVDPRAPRFGQAITATGLLAGVLLDIPALIYAVAAVLLLSAASGWRIDLYGIVFKALVKPRLPPAEPESAVPHRFAKLIGVVGTAFATGFLVFGVPLAGYAIAVVVAVAAGLAATTGYCIGCRLYSQVSLFRRLSLV